TQTVELEKIDLIVMGTKGATNAVEILFGTNAVHAIKRAKCPIIAVPKMFEFKVPHQILFPTDYEIQYKKKKFDQLLQIANLHGSRINVMHVRAGYKLTEEQKKNKKQLKGILPNLSIFHDVPDSDIIHEINEIMDKEKIDLLVMVQNKHTFFERLFMEPVIKKIGFQVSIPFMVIPY